MLERGFRFSFSSSIKELKTWRRNARAFLIVPGALPFFVMRSTNEFPASLSMVRMSIEPKCGLRWFAAMPW